MAACQKSVGVVNVFLREDCVTLCAGQDCESDAKSVESVLFVAVIIVFQGYIARAGLTRRVRPCVKDFRITAGVFGE